MSTDPQREPRSRILEQVAREPGLHARALQRALGIPLGTLLYHLEVLESARRVRVHADARRKCYFPAGTPAEDCVLLLWLRQPTPCRVLAALSETPRGATLRELTARLPVSPSTLSWHLGRLAEAALISEQAEGRTKRYRLLDGERTARLLAAYGHTLMGNPSAQQGLDVETASGLLRGAPGAR